MTRGAWLQLSQPAARVQRGPRMW